MTVDAEHLADTGADTASTRWRRWSTSMQIVVTDPDPLAVARREVDAELDVIDAAASRFRPDSEINSLAMSAGRPTQVSEVLRRCWTRHCRRPA
jgi:thiamine biosynthesis lipoprotein